MPSSHQSDKLRQLSALEVDGSVNRLAVVLGDQLALKYEMLRSLSKSEDAVLMMEVVDEATHVASHRQRTLVFLAAMRHFALALSSRGYRVHYVQLDDPDNTQSFAGEIERVVGQLEPERLECIHPGEWRVLSALKEAASACDLPLTVHEDDHFLVSRDAFAGWMSGRKSVIMEHFYRWQRKELDILMEPDGSPVGGTWNFDKENRKALRSAPDARKPYQPRMNPLTLATAETIERRLPESPGSLDGFRWPVTREQALRALSDFAEHRLPHFGTYQDAMWEGEPFLYHSLLSAALNLKLLRPMECVHAAIEAYESGAAPLNAVEGFVRQIIGWREFIRGVYWHEGPEYPERNALGDRGSLPEFYWTGETDMACMRDSIGQVLEHGYGHHIQRLMVTGNFALIAGVEPRQVNDWYRGMYVDAVDWATTPNVIGMVMHADGGVVGTKPYAASGQYIKRMSNHCAGCRYDPGERTGDGACPFTTFYWDFLLRHEDALRANQRMSLIMKNVDRIESKERSAISERAADFRSAFDLAP